jgi:hypothetical protein
MFRGETAPSELKGWWQLSTPMLNRSGVEAASAGAVSNSPAPTNRSPSTDSTLKV